MSGRLNDPSPKAKIPDVNLQCPVDAVAVAERALPEKFPIERQIDAGERPCSYSSKGPRYCNGGYSPKP